MGGAQWIPFVWADELRIENSSHAFNGVDVVVKPIGAVFRVLRDAEILCQPSESTFDRLVFGGVRLSKFVAAESHCADAGGGHASVRVPLSFEVIAPATAVLLTIHRRLQ